MTKRAVAPAASNFSIDDLHGSCSHPGAHRESIIQTNAAGVMLDRSPTYQRRIGGHQALPTDEKALQLNRIKIQNSKNIRITSVKLSAT